jgi:tetratricopeptide (TPR) repeat protein
MATAARAFDTPASFLRYSRSMPWNYDLQQARHKEMLYRALNLGTTVAFLGAGCSLDFGLPDWANFASAAVLVAWANLADARDGANKQRTRYQEKVIEFAHELTIDDKTTTDIQAKLPDYDLKIDTFLATARERFEKNNKDNQWPREKASGDQLRFILGACKQICNWCDSKAQPAKKDSFLRFLSSFFVKELTELDWTNNKDGVHRRLLALPFHRFITSNYDLILEQFLARNLGKPLTKEKVEEFLQEKSFAQVQRGSEKLARFAAGMTDNSRNMIFHCHGWYKDPDSMIVTEEDYQKWYLGHADGAGPAFRQTMELLVGSHPIVFVGFGMKDPDLLMALRTLSATEPEHKGQRSLFAILSEAEAKYANGMERLFDQYGVHVIGYEVDDPKQKSSSLATFLNNLNQHWKTGRDSWLLKPKIHRVQIPVEQIRRKQYWHYELKPFELTSGLIMLRDWRMLEYPASDQGTSPELTAGCTELNVLVDRINEEKEQGHIAVLVGPGGSGKSFCAAQLVKRLLKKKESDYKCFFWSSYYDDDALTGIIRANEFFNGISNKKGDNGLSRLQVFANHLEDAENILVLDGLERFLRPVKDRPGTGIAANGGVSDFLDILKKLGTKGTKYKATAVLTSRLAPGQLTEKAQRAVFFNVVPMTKGEVANLAEFRELPEDERMGLVALLDGHRYAVDLATLWPPREIGDLSHFLGNVGPLRHLERMIELTLCRLDQDPDKTGSARQRGIRDYHQCDGRRPYQLLMKRLAVFMGPIKKKTSFQYCWNLAQKEWLKIQREDKNLETIGDFPGQDAMWKELTENKLLFEIVPPSDQPPDEKESCVMHAVVREFVFHHFHEADAHRLASFTQTGFTSGANMVDPGKKGAEIVEELFCEMRRQCRKAFNSWGAPKDSEPGKKVEIGGDQIEDARNLCEEAFGVLRSRMLANTVARWGSYTKYIKHLVRMGDLARAYSGMVQKALLSNVEKRPKELFWNHFDPALCAGSKGVIHEHGPLFDDELAWLYHELGLALYHEGAMIDCLAMWEQGLEVNRFLDGNEPGQYTFQAYCNLGAACIQYGRLRRAREYLQMAKEISIRAGNKDKDHAPRLDGYLALIRHLRGDLLLADREYGKAIHHLAETDNARAECIFLRHRADLKLKLREKNLAGDFIRSCRAKAEEGHFPDLVAHARLSEGHLFRVCEKYQDAIREYKVALKAAKQYGMRGLEADVYSELAHLALDLGDTETARTRAIKSLQIANELHLGLRQTHGLVVLGKATAKAGQQALGVEYLKQARELAERQHYELRAREAEEELHRLGAMGFLRAPLQ